MPESSVRIRDLPHYRIAAAELAKWIADQDEESWWTVDGDPVLTQRVDFPCPGPDLAVALIQIGKSLLLLDPRDTSTASEETISSQQLDDVAYTDDFGDRVFRLCWEDGPDVDWLLVEDTQTSENSAGLNGE
jgi:hypothetical protein